MSRLYSCTVTGWARYGCRVINPPVFLSEDEAAKVIQDEARRAGINFSKDGRKLPNIEMPTNARLEIVTKKDGTTEWVPKTDMQVLPSLSLDGFDKKRNIAYEFVSKQDLHAWQTGVTDMGSVGREDLITTAKALASGIAKTKPGGAFGVFYEPLTSWEEARKKAGLPASGKGNDFNAQEKVMKAAANEIVREQLRAQVKDFIKWLKAQGVI